MADNRQMGKGTHVCGSCDAPVESGRRWCPRCKSTDLRYTAPEASAILEVRPPRIIDDRAIWGTADPRSAFQRTHAPERRLHSEMAQSRWRRGATTFGPAGRITITIVLILPVAFVWWVINGATGPVMATAFTLGLCGAWVVVSHTILKDVWGRDRVDTSSMPLRSALSETRGSFRKDSPDETSPYACGSCGTPRRPGATRCYRCSATHWFAISGPSDFFLCSGCERPWPEDSAQQWCAHCKSPRSAAIYISPAAG